MGWNDSRSPYNLKRIHAGFRVGAMVGVIMAVVHWALILMARTDILTYIIHPFVYFLAGRSAAEQHYQAQQDIYEPCRGVRAAGLGAALVISIITWFSIILYFIIGDALGWDVIFLPVNAYCVAVIDALVAMGLGYWGGNTVFNKYGCHNQ